MSHKMLRPFIVKVSVLGYFPLRLKSIYNTINMLYNYNNPCCYNIYIYIIYIMPFTAFIINTSIN